MKGRSYVTFFLMLVLVVFTAGTSAANVRADDDVLLPVTHQLFNGVVGPITQEGDGFVSLGNYRNPPSPICSTSTSSAANVNTDCEGNAPHNETSIAINPTNSLNIVGSANDYQLALTPGGYAQETVYSRAHVSFDAGKTWTMYPINYKNYTSTGDPAVAFDLDGTAYLATLGFSWSQSSFCCTNPDVLVAHSTDGGKNWSKPSRVVAGSGVLSSPGLSNDKEYIAAWGHGNAIVTWTEYNDGKGGSYISSPIFASVTHDSGNTWSKPAEISGSAQFCIGAQGGNTCNQDQFSVPAVAADGSIYVAFLNFAEPSTTGRDQYLVVKVDPSTGQRVAGPYKVALVYDGFTDYPINIDGRQTLQDSEFRTNASGDIVADPTHAQHLAVVWSDTRNGPATSSDPYATTTNSDVIVSQSTDGGQTWSAPTAIPARGDQFQPWGAYGSDGRLRAGYFDRSYDGANHKYGYTLATETVAGSLNFGTTQLTTALSDPTKDVRWFSARTPNPDFPHPTTFMGDYSGISLNGTTALWTDMRVQIDWAGRSGSGEDAFYASAP